jgi:glycosyltransferase involved in cell wall biosynthesis
MELNDEVKIMHSGIQHSPRLAFALQKNNKLKKFYVGYYFKPGTNFIKISRFFFSKSLFNSLIKKKHFDGVDFQTEKILTFPYFNFSIVLVHKLLNKFKIYNTIGVTYFSNIIFDYYISLFYIGKNDRIVVSYLNTSFYTFKKVKKNNGKCVIDYATIHFDTIQRILNEEKFLSPEFSSQLKDSNSPNMKRINEELQMSDYIIVPSSFSKKSIVENGIDSNKVHIIPYGSNFKSISNNEFKNYLKGDVLKILFVGQIQQRKGIKYLLKAISILKKENLPIDLKLVGDIYGCEEELSKYNCFEHKPFMNKKDLNILMKDSHILVLPTLYDSFGLVTLEGMSSGLLPIISENAGSKDVVGIEEGFIIPIRDSQIIIERIKYLLDNPQILNLMRKNSIEKSKKFSWEKYYENINELFEKI